MRYPTARNYGFGRQTWRATTARVLLAVLSIMWLAPAAAACTRLQKATAASCCPQQHQNLVSAQSECHMSMHMESAACAEVLSLKNSQTSVLSIQPATSGHPPSSAVIATVPPYVAIASPAAADRPPRADSPATRSELGFRVLLN